MGIFFYNSVIWAACKSVSSTLKQNNKKIWDEKNTHTEHLRKAGEKKKLNENVDVYKEIHY